MNDENCFGTVMWCNGDIVNLLYALGVDATKENIEAVRCECESNHHFTDRMIEAGWESMEDAARVALGL